MPRHVIRRGEAFDHRWSIYFNLANECFALTNSSPRNSLVRHRQRPGHGAGTPSSRLRFFQSAARVQHHFDLQSAIRRLAHRCNPVGGQGSSADERPGTIEVDCSLAPLGTFQRVEALNCGADVLVCTSNVDKGRAAGDELMHSPPATQSPLSPTGQPAGVPVPANAKTQEAISQSDLASREFGPPSATN